MARRDFLLYLVTIILLIIYGECAPKRGKKGDQIPHTVYDQKQTGDYNIQLHLKDFQIIALLGDDTGNFGDYDYTYDYSDFTIKPATQKPTEVLISSTTTPVPLSTTKSSIVSQTNKPFYQTYPLVQPITVKSENETAKPISTENPLITTTTNNQSLQELPNLNLNLTITNTSTTQKSSKLDDVISLPGKIKVQIIETPVRMGVIPGEELPEQNETLPQGEILQLKRCAQGFTRDKRGRCRRVRRPGNVQPQLSYGFSRLASNLASRLRQTSEENSASSSESKED